MYPKKPNGQRSGLIIDLAKRRQQAIAANQALATVLVGSPLVSVRPGTCLLRLENGTDLVISGRELSREEQLETAIQDFGLTWVIETFADMEWVRAYLKKNDYL